MYTQHQVRIRNESLMCDLGLPIGAALLGPDNTWWKPVVFNGVSVMILCNECRWPKLHCRSLSQPELAFSSLPVSYLHGARIASGFKVPTCLNA